MRAWFTHVPFPFLEGVLGRGQLGQSSVPRVPGQASRNLALTLVSRMMKFEFPFGGPVGVSVVSIHQSA